MLRLWGQDIVHYFHEKHILTHPCFQYMLSCIRHDDIVPKIDSAGFRIFVSLEFYVSPFLFQRHIHCLLHRQMHLNMDLEFGTPILFNYSVIILRDNMQDYDINRVKLVCLLTLNYLKFL
jgi:hypothetical protein